MNLQRHFDQINDMMGLRHQFEPSTIDIQEFSTQHFSIYKAHFDNSLIKCYKCVFSLNNLEFQDFFQFASNRMRSNHSYKLQFKASSCNCYKYSFFIRTVKECNDLPEWVVGVGNLACFKQSLESF